MVALTPTILGRTLFSYLYPSCFNRLTKNDGGHLVLRSSNELHQTQYASTRFQGLQPRLDFQACDETIQCLQGEFEQAHPPIDGFGSFKHVSLCRLPKLVHLYLGGVDSLHTALFVRLAGLF